MEQVEKTELLRRLSFCALSKIQLESTGLFTKFCLYSLEIQILILGQCMELKIKICFTYILPFHDCIFPGDGFYYNLNSLRENVS